jgi:hypothetical protein
MWPNRCQPASQAGGPRKKKKKAELAPTRELVPTLVLKNCPRGAKEYARVLNL